MSFGAAYAETDKLRYEAAEAMHAALVNLPCRCLHNVPYWDCKVKRVLIQECARCKSIKQWEISR